MLSPVCKAFGLSGMHWRAILGSKVELSHETGFSLPNRSCDTMFWGCCTSSELMLQGEETARGPGAPPSRVQATTALLVAGFVRPFTVKAAQALFEAHGRAPSYYSLLHTFS